MFKNLDVAISWAKRQADVQKWAIWEGNDYPDNFIILPDGTVLKVEGYGWHDTAMLQFKKALKNLETNLTEDDVDRGICIRKNSERYFFIYSCTQGMPNGKQKRILQDWFYTLPPDTRIENCLVGMEATGSNPPSRIRRADGMGNWFEHLPKLGDDPNGPSRYITNPESVERGPYEDRRKKRRYDQDGLKTMTNTQESMGHDKMTDYRPGGGGNVRTYKTMWGSNPHKNGRGQS